MTQAESKDLKIVVEQVVRPIRASVGRKRKMREELLAHLEAVFVEESTKQREEGSALDRTKQRFGVLSELTKQLQNSVPSHDFIERTLESFAFRPGEPTVHRLVRYSLVWEVFAFIALIVAWLHAWQRDGMTSDWSFQGSWCVGVAYFGLFYWISILVIVESRTREVVRQPGVQFGSWPVCYIAAAHACLFFWYFGIGQICGIPLKISLLFFLVTMGIGALFCLGAGSLAHIFAERDREHQEWGSLQISE
jgi:hypothetical protein